MTISRQKAMLLVSVITVALPALGGAADVQAKLKRNPFERPPIEALTPQAPSTIGRQDEEWSPLLRAVLVAGAKSVADLGGVILQIGESTNGYRLLAVSEAAATFSRKGEKIVISLYEQQVSEEQ